MDENDNPTDTPEQLPHDAVDGTEPEAVEVIDLSPEDSLIFAEAILNPPEPSPAMIRAAALHRKNGHQ